MECGFPVSPDRYSVFLEKTSYYLALVRSKIDTMASLLGEFTSTLLGLIGVALPMLSTSKFNYNFTLQHPSQTPDFGFNVTEATISTVHDALFSKRVSCRDIVSAFILQIETYNPVINAVISLNPHALDVADEIDGVLKRGLDGIETGSLLCVPVLLKDNFDVVGMKTTAGCRALKDIQPMDDAPVVKALKDAGAVILGKTNMHELALEGISVSSLGGQTLNPYDLTRTPGGSSGGTGAAIAASFAVLGTGTDTVNSVRNPASANSLYGLRPTRGLISRNGVVPVSYTQDAVGPIARTLEDLAVALEVMTGVGYDPADNTTALPPPSARNVDYVSALSSRKDLSGVRLGVLEGFFNRSLSPETTPVNLAVDNMISKLEAAGATIIRITDPVYHSPTILSTMDVQAYEFEESINTYLAPYKSSLSKIYATAPTSSLNNYLVLPYQSPLLTSALSPATTPSSHPYLSRQHLIRNLTLSLITTFTTHALTALIYPQQQNLVVKLSSPSQSGRNGILAAVTGSPVVTIPVGFSQPSEDAPVGVPIGMEILGREWDESGILGVAGAIERVVGRGRRAPVFAGIEKEKKGKRSGKGKWYRKVPRVEPDLSGISEAYPLGRLE